jgi:hypothetical protein
MVDMMCGSTESVPVLNQVITLNQSLKRIENDLSYFITGFTPECKPPEEKEKACLDEISYLLGCNIDILDAINVKIRLIENKLRKDLKQEPTSNISIRR